MCHMLGPIAQSVARLTREQEVPVTVRSLTFVSPSRDSRKADVSYWQKYVHLLLHNRKGGLSLARNSLLG